jgi:hypothetical protein
MSNVQNYVFSQIFFFGKAIDTNIHSESFVEFNSAHFSILIEPELEEKSSK